MIKYNLTLGGFLNKKSVFIQDYKYFYGNISHIAKEYVQTFQAASYYQFSNTSSFFSEVHFEHRRNGLLTNKIPLFKKLNWNLVYGTKALHINPNVNYAEVFVGLENIFKLFRFDVLGSYQNGHSPQYIYRVGFDGLPGASVNSMRFSKKKKLINDY